MKTYILLHSYKEEIIIPYVGVKDNINFIFDKEDRYVMTNDGIKCKVVSCVECNILDLEEDIRRLYNIDIITWLKKWHNANKYFDSLGVLKIKLKKE